MRAYGGKVIVAKSAVRTIPALSKYREHDGGGKSWKYYGVNQYDNLNNVGVRNFRTKIAQTKGLITHFVAG